MNFPRASIPAPLTRALPLATLGREGLIPRQHRRAKVETSFNAAAPAPSAAPRRRIRARRRAGLLRATCLGDAAGSLLAVGEAFAQAASTARQLGAQMNTMSSEVDRRGRHRARHDLLHRRHAAASSGAPGRSGSRASRRTRSPADARSKAPPARSSCGLLVMMPQWINKAAHTVAGADATINNTPAQVKFAP